MDCASWTSLVGSLQALASADGGFFAGPAERVVRVKQVVASLLLCEETVSVREAMHLWVQALPALCALFRETALPDVAVVTEHLAALLLWRVHVRTFKLLDDLDGVRQLVDEMNSEASVRALEDAGLRRTSRLGPESMRRTVVAWLALFRNMYGRALQPVEQTDADGQTEAPGAWTGFGVPDTLIAGHFALLYDMPFTQTALHTLAIQSNWKLSVSLLLRCARNPAAPPLTRALAAVAAVDELPVDAVAVNTTGVLTPEGFAELSKAVPRDAFVSLCEVNTTPQTAHDVRVSAALAYNNPHVRDVPAGSVITRLRGDPDLMADGTVLAPAALALHAAGAARLLRVPRFVPTAAAAAVTRLAECAAAAWDALQASRSAAAAAYALVTAGFTARHCVLLERVIFNLVAERRVAGGVPAPLTEAQQAVGCVAVVGAVVFRLLSRYGPTRDYVTHYTTTMDEFTTQHGDLLAPLGIPDGGAEQLLRSCMAPRPQLQAIEDTRTLLMDEVSATETALGPNVRSAVREVLGAWFGLRAHQRWGLSLPGPGPPASTPWIPAAQPARTPGPGAMLRAALRVRYPLSDQPDPTVLLHAGFPPYLVAVLLGDVLSAVRRARFTPRLVQRLVALVTWTRDYAADVVPNVDGYRTKLSAFAFSVLPFASTAAPAPTVAQIENLEALLGELWTTADAALQACHTRTFSAIGDKKPAPHNSRFLATALAAALAGGLKDGAAHTADLAESLMIVAESIDEAVVNLSRLFGCSFAVNQTRGTLAVYATLEARRPVGEWPISHVIDAVSKVYADVDAWRCDARVDAGDLRSLLTQTLQALRLCESLALNGETAGALSAATFRTLLEGYRRLVRVQTDLEAAGEELTLGAEPVGLRDVAVFLRRWESLDVALRQAFGPTTTEKHVIALAEMLRTVWDALCVERDAAPPPALEPEEVMAAAVLHVLKNYDECTATETSADGATLNARVNIRDWGEVDRMVLRVHPTAPGGPDAPAADLVLTHTWVTPEELLAVADDALGPSRPVAPTSKRDREERADDV